MVVFHACQGRLSSKKLQIRCLGALVRAVPWLRKEGMTLMPLHREVCAMLGFRGPVRSCVQNSVSGARVGEHLDELPTGRRRGRSFCFRSHFKQSQIHNLRTWTYIAPTSRLHRDCWQVRQNFQSTAAVPAQIRQPPSCHCAAEQLRRGSMRQPQDEAPAGPDLRRIQEHIMISPLALFYKMTRLAPL